VAEPAIASPLTEVFYNPWNTMEAYETKTQEIITRFLDNQLSFPDCIASLDASLAALIPTLTGEQIPRLRLVMLANNEIVMKEMERRGRAVK
jgi:hypothetical protein